MDTKRLSSSQIRWAQELSRYNFRIDYRQGTRGPADALSRSAQLDADDDELVVENTQILYRLQVSCLDVPITRAFNGDAIFSIFAAGSSLVSHSLSISVAPKPVSIPPMWIELTESRA